MMGTKAFSVASMLVSMTGPLSCLGLSRQDFEGRFLNLASGTCAGTLPLSVKTDLAVRDTLCHACQEMQNSLKNEAQHYEQP